MKRLMFTASLFVAAWSCSSDDTASTHVGDAASDDGSSNLDAATTGGASGSAGRPPLTDAGLMPGEDATPSGGAGGATDAASPTGGASPSDAATTSDAFTGDLDGAAPSDARVDGVSEDATPDATIEDATPDAAIDASTEAGCACASTELCGEAGGCVAMNDRCEDAIDATSGGSWSGNPCNAVNDDDFSCSTGRSDVYFHLAAGDYLISVQGNFAAAATQQCPRVSTPSMCFSPWPSSLSQYTFASETWLVLEPRGACEPYSLRVIGF